MQLLGQRYLVFVSVVEHQAQKPPELSRHALGRAWLVVNQGSNGIERVEESGVEAAF